ncbi:MAG TPA: ROK family transcriptional regulator [Trueperaceae bacterium]
MSARKPRLNSALIRQLNVSRVFHALRLAPRSSQRDLVALTGLDRATVSAVVSELESNGVIERSVRESGRPGRPQISLTIAEGAGALLGARLEPDGIRLIATTLAGDPLGSLQVAGSLEAEMAVDLLVEAVAELLAKVDLEPERVRGMGVGVPALMSEAGRLAFAPNLHWRNVWLRDLLGNRLPFPVYFDNDTKAAALAEKLFGCCRDVRDFLFIAGHSGIGGGLYLDGTLYRGHNGYAGEIGHLKVRPGGRECGCGGRGCLEAYISEKAILARLADLGVALADLRAVAGAAEAGDERVLALMEESGELLGEACANLVNLFNPELIVLGGNITLLARFMRPALERALESDALSAPLSASRVRVSPLGTEVVPMGGVALALEGVLSLPSWLAASEIRDMVE